MLTATCELQVEVTQQDIEKGERGNCGKCPIALAVARAGFSPQVIAQEQFIHWRHPERPRWYRARTPMIAYRLMNAYDLAGYPEGERFGRPAPISFRLDGILLEEGRNP